MPSTLLTQVRARPNFKPAAKGTVNKVRHRVQDPPRTGSNRGRDDPRHADAYPSPARARRRRVGTGKKCFVRSGPLQVDSPLRRRLKPRVVDLRRERHKRAHISLTL